MKLNEIYNHDKIYYIIVIIFSLLCAGKMMLFSLNGGILNPDSSLYLISALKYAGIDHYNISNPNSLFFTPIISFLTSLIFRLGLIDKAAIIIVTTIFSFLSYIGLFILLKKRFNSLLSLTGIIIYGSLSVIIFNISKGLIDIPALSISIWILIFAFKAIDDNPRYFLITFPLLVIGFFIKYTVGFTLPVIFLYYLMNKDIIGSIDFLLYDKKIVTKALKEYLKSKEFKYIMISILLSIVLFVIICKTLILDYGGSLIFIQQSTETFNGHVYDVNRLDYNPHKSYYLSQLTTILYERHPFDFILSNVIYVIFILGFIFNLIDMRINNKKINRVKSFISTNFKKRAIGISVILAIISVIFFIIFPNHMICNISLLALFTILYSILKQYDLNYNTLSLDITFLAYFAVNFVFISMFPVKVPRYSLVFLPAVIYFIIWGLDSILNVLTNKFSTKECIYIKKDINKRFSTSSSIITILIIVLFLSITVSVMGPMEIERSNNIYIDVNYKGFVNDLSDVCNFIIHNDTNYHSKTFASYFHHARIINWYLNTNTTVLQEGNSSLKDFNGTDYIILNEKIPFKNYRVISHNGDFYLYKHKK